MSSEAQAVIFATLASLFGAGSAIFAEGAIHKLGAFHFTRYVIAIAAVGLLVAALMKQSTLPEANAWRYLLSSSFVGLLLGDLLIWRGLKGLGPRRNSLIYALNVPFTVIMAYMFLGETLSTLQLVGISTAFTGVMLAISFKSALSSSEQHVSASLVGVFAALGGAVCQACGVILAKPAFAMGTSPLSAAAIRVCLAALLLNGFAMMRGRSEARSPMDRETALRVLGAAVLGPGLGLAFIMAGLSTGKAGLVSMFSSLSPLFILPILTIRGETPRGLAWVTCGITVAGTLVILWPHGA